MKALTLALLCLGASSAFAGNPFINLSILLEPNANAEQTRAFCQAVDQYLENEVIDAAVDMDLCLQTKFKVTKRSIRGKVPVNAPNDNQEKWNCDAALKKGKVQAATAMCG